MTDPPHVVIASSSASQNSPHIPEGMASWRRVARGGVLAGLSTASAAWAGAVPTPAVALTWSELVVAGLKFTGLMVGTLSTIWGLTQKLTYDDIDGAKHLTREGKAAIALAISSFLVAGVAASVELISANITKQNQIIADAARVAADAEETRKRDVENAKRQLEFLETQSLARFNESRRQADVAAQRLMDLQAAAAQEGRAASLALQVGRGTAANLARTQLALGELERILQPLGFPVMTLEWHVRADTPEKIALVKPIDEIATRVRAGDPAVLAALELGPMVPEYARKLATIVLKPRFAVYPGHGTLLRDVISATRRGIMLTPDNARLELPAILDSEGTRAPLWQRGDVRFNFDLGAPVLTYQIDSKLLSFKSTWKPTGWINQTGNIVSIPDLEKATIVIDPGSPVRSNQRSAALRNTLRAQILPNQLTIAANGRYFTLEGPQFRRVATSDGHPLFIVTVVGKARFPRGIGEGQHSSADAAQGPRSD